MEQGRITVKGSIEFRDAAIELSKKGSEVYASLAGSAKTYRILTGTMSRVTVEDLFSADHPPILMEDFATALVIADKNGKDVPTIDVFTP
jgi:hypothetical protein